MCFTILRLLVKQLKIERIVKNENFNPIIRVILQIKHVKAKNVCN